MTLEEKLNHYQKADQWILKQYTKYSKDLEGKKLYKTCMMMVGGGALLTIPAFAYMAVDNNLSQSNFNVLGFTHGAIVGFDMALNMFGLINPDDVDGGEGNSKVINPGIHYLKKWNEKVRLPLVGFALGFPGYFALNSLFSNSVSDSNLIASTVLGIGLMGYASSMYLKDRDPKLLDKQTNKTTDFLEKLFPQKQSEPLLGYSTVK